MVLLSNIQMLASQITKHFYSGGSHADAIHSLLLLLLLPHVHHKVV
jgi:hypothetical protein